MKKYSVFLFKLSVSIGLLYYLFRHTDFHELWKSLQKISLFWFIAAFICYLTFQTISTWRWKIICESLGFKRSFIYFLKLYFINQYFNAFLPGLLGGDIIRIGYLIKDGTSKTAATLSVFYDRAFGFLGALGLVLISMPFEGDFLPEITKHSLYLICTTILIGSLILFFAKIVCKENIKYAKLLLASSVFRFPVFWMLFLLGTLVQIFYSFHLYLLGYGLGMHLSLGKYLIIVPVMGILAALPVSLGGLGVREGTLVYFLKQLGYGPEYGLALGILVYAIILLGGAIGGIVYLKRGSIN